MESFIARFKAKATKARQAQSRIKALERLEELAPAHVDSPFNFSFRESDKISRPLLDLGEGRLGYGDKAVLEKVKLQLVPGARIGLLGPNGAGKSTLIKTLAGDLPELAAACCAARTWPSDTSPSTSSIRWTHRPARCCICSVSPRRARTDPQGLPWRLRLPRRSGGRAGIELSGGEKARLALALIAWQKPNLLLLDEPTNHLDLEMRLALTLALQEFSGAVLVVSTTGTCSKAPPTNSSWSPMGAWCRSMAISTITPAGWSTIARARRRRPRPRRARRPNAPTSAPSARQRPRCQQLAPHKREADKLERELGGLHEKLAAIEARLGDSALYDVSRKDELRELLSEQSSLKVREGELEERWLEALETLEALQKELEASE